MNGILLFKSAFKSNLSALSSSLSRLNLASTKCIDLNQQSRCESTASSSSSSNPSTFSNSNMMSMVNAFSTDSKQTTDSSKVSIDEYKRRPLNSFMLYVKKNYAVESKNNPSIFISSSF